MKVILNYLEELVKVDDELEWMWLKAKQAITFNNIS